MSRIKKLLAVTGISAALAVGGAGVAQAASVDHSGQKSPDRGAQTMDHHGKRHEKHHKGDKSRHDKNQSKRDASGKSRR